MCLLYLMVPIWADSPLSRAPCSLASSLNHYWCRSLASTLKSEFRRSVVPVVMHCGRGRVLWRCARARSRDRWRRRVELLGCMAGCSVTCACCLLTGLPARLGVLCGLLLLRTSVDRQLICTGPRVEQLPKSTFRLNPRALRFMAAVSEITIARAGSCSMA